MSLHPHSFHRSKQALRFCTTVQLPANLPGRNRTTRSLLLTANPQNTVTYSQTNSSQLDTMASAAHVQKAWEHWKKLGSPQFIVAPMVDQSELPFRMLCRQYGATAAYTPMLHARLFSEGAKYRDEHLTTCPEDRPLFVQFCANDPDVLVNAAQHVEPAADYIDLNFGCPQRIAKKGRYGAFLMDDLPCVACLVRALHECFKHPSQFSRAKHLQRTSTPVSAKIRIFPELSRTLEYAKLIETSGASLVAVHGRTREQKDAAAVRADWDSIKAVKDALRIPVLGNGDIQSRADAVRMMEYTGVDGVMSASPLLEDPRLFWEDRGAAEPYAPLKCFEMAQEYLKLCEKYPVNLRMVRGHIHKIVGAWFQEHTDIRDEFNKPPEFTVAFCQKIVTKLEAAALEVGRDHPVPKISERKLARLAREEAISGAKTEQEREDRAVATLEKKRQRAAPAAEPELKNGDNAKAERDTHKQAECSEANGKERAGSGTAEESAVKESVATDCTASEPVVELSTNSWSDIDQNNTSLQNVGGSTNRKQARLMSSANG